MICEGVCFRHSFLEQVFFYPLEAKIRLTDHVDNTIGMSLKSISQPQTPQADRYYTNLRYRIQICSYSQGSVYYLFFQRKKWLLSICPDKGKPVLYRLTYKLNYTTGSW